MNEPTIDMMKVKETYERYVEKIRSAGGLKPTHEFHNLTTDEHIIRVAQAAYAMYFSSDLHTIAMLHDIGKFEVHEDGKFPKHAEASAEIARSIGVPEYLCVIIEQHSWIYNIHECGQKSVRKFLRKLTKDGEYDQLRQLSLYIMLQECDKEGFSEVGREQREKDIKVFMEKVNLAIDKDIEKALPPFVRGKAGVGKSKVMEEYYNGQSG